MSAEPVVLRRLLPEPGTTTAAELLDGVDFGDLAGPDRPYLVLNMVTTLDGAAALDGRTAPMSDPADRALFHQLRGRVDAVLVGAGTARAERYGRLARDPALRAQRAGRGLAPDPLAVLVSRTLDLPADLPLLADEESRVVVLTGSPGELAPCAAQVGYLRPAGATGFDLGELLRGLRAEYGVRSVLCEGGPLLNGSLLPAGLVDELFLSTAPLLAGDRGTRRIAEQAALPGPIACELVWLLESNGQLFARYALPHS